MTIDALSLDDDRARDPGVSGAKAAGLARLRAEGFTVPDGVVLPVGLAAAWPGGPAPDAVRAAVADALGRLGDRLAVRSSTQWEDAEASAHAGASRTELDVCGVDGVLAAVRRCLDDTELARRAQGGLGDVAILLQTLVPAEWAGVAFTVDPVTGEQDVVRVAATAGLGEALVQGEVVGADLTVRDDRVEGEHAGFATDDALAVAELARQVAARLGGPQDLEWAIAEGQVHLLQARPVTVVPVPPRLPEGNNWQKDVAHYPEPVTPFGWSVLQAPEHEVRSVFDEMGLLVRGLEEMTAGGEAYGRVVPAMGSPDGAGSPPPAIVMGIAARLVPELRRRTATARHVLESGTMQAWVDQWHRRDRQELIDLAAELGEVDLGALDDAGMVEHADAVTAVLRRGFRIHFRLVMPTAHALYRLHRLVGDELGWDDQRIAPMLAGHSPATRAAEEAMAALRTRVRATPGAVAALEADRRHPVDVLAGLDGGLADELAAWVTEHGWAMVNYDAGVATLAERPAMVTRLVLSEPEPADGGEADRLAAEAREALPAERRAELDAALAEARALYPLREDNTIITGDRPMALLRRWMLETGRRLAERGTIAAPGHAAHLELAELRAALAGEDQGDLAAVVARRRGEEAWARAHPGPLHVGEQAPPPDISHLPRPLREVNEPILWFIGHEYPPPTEVPDDEEVLLAGVAASPGVAEGPARIIRGHADMGRLEDGDVLVCQVTSPAWSPVFPLAAAVVADGGGVLSHAAIAAREHGLPAVLGTGAGTTTLVDGQRVRVDGARGLVVAAPA